jgi:hypothetical protein
VGTDVFGALSLAEDYFAAYPGAATRRLVVLSDMVQRARGLRFPSVGDWSDPAVRQMLEAAPRIALEGIEVYVVGAGGTSSDAFTPEQIEGFERFWRAYLKGAGAEVRFFGASLARFPI